MKRLLLLLALSPALFACTDNFDKRLAEEAKTYTRQHLPQQLDSYTRLDSIVYNADQRMLLQYHTLRDIAPELLQENRASLEAAVLDRLKGDPKWQDCKDEGIDFGFEYRFGGEAAPALRFVFTPGDYSAR